MVNKPIINTSVINVDCKGMQMEENGQKQTFRLNSNTSKVL